MELGAEPAPEPSTASQPAAAKPSGTKRKLAKLRLEGDSHSRIWRVASVPIAAVAVVGGLLLIQDGGSEPQPVAGAASTTDSSATDAVGGSGGAGQAGDAGQSDPSEASANTGSAELVRGSAYSLALPPGWEQTQPEGGASFAAVAVDGSADAQLRITEDPSLDYPAFIRQSLQQLELLAGSARIVARVPAPSAEGTIVTLAADAPTDQPRHEVTLRVSGPYRYYLATTVQPGASRAAVSGSELISGSLTPEG